MDNRSHNFNVGYGNGLRWPTAPAGDASATEPAMAGTEEQDLGPLAPGADASAAAGDNKSYLVADPTSPEVPVMPVLPGGLLGPVGPAEHVTPSGPGASSRRGLVLTAIAAAALLTLLATGGVVATRRSSTTVELGSARHAGGVNADDPDNPNGGADALRGSNGLIMLDGSIVSGPHGTIVLDDGSVIEDPNPIDPNAPPPTSTNATTPTATDAGGHPVVTNVTNTTSTTIASGPTGATTPTSGSPGPGATTTTTPAVTVTVTTPPVTVSTPTVTVTTPATLGPPPMSVPTVTINPSISIVMISPQLLGFTGPTSSGCPVFFKGSNTITLTWSTKYASSVSLWIDGTFSQSYANENGSALVSFGCASTSHTYTLRAVNSGGSSGPKTISIPRS